MLQSCQALALSTDRVDEAQQALGQHMHTARSGAPMGSSQVRSGVMSLHFEVSSSDECPVQGTAGRG